ncbi:hypothetical protein [Vibrio coralliirubri]|uniref:hypothetical protein n=1 Tax=Vibrio coralliirubri TaxID=1516159 RepID=UPI00192E5A29|nr:hypothetical protein [Vibrio coralliirubri]
MKKTILALALALAATTMSVNAAYLDENTGEVVVPENPELLGDSARGAEDAPDPSDLTKVNSFLWGQASNKNDLKVNLGLAGAFSEGNNYMALIEHNYNTKEKADNSRLRYFQVLDTGLTALPQAGVSIDYMRGWGKNSSDLVAIGTIGKVATPWESFTLFPNVAYVTGNAKHDAGKIDTTGYQANLYGSLSISDWGQYIMFQPQYMHLDSKQNQTGAKVPVDISKMKTVYGQPFTSDGKWWFDVTHEYTNTQTKEKIEDKSLNEHRFEFGVAYYF